jgi:phasin family protein
VARQAAWANWRTFGASSQKNVDSAFGAAEFVLEFESAFASLKKERHGKIPSICARFGNAYEKMIVSWCIQSELCYAACQGCRDGPLVIFIYFFAVFFLFLELIMSILNQELLSSTRSTLDSLAQLSQIVLDSTEQTTRLSLQTSRKLLDESIASSQSILGVRNAQELGKLSSSLTQPVLAHTLDFSRALFEITAKTQASLSKLAESRYDDFRQSFDNLLERAAERAPSGSEAGFTLVKSVFSSTNSLFDTAFETLNKASKRASELAEANVATISDNIIAAKSASASASTAASAATSESKRKQAAA